MDVKVVHVSVSLFGGLCVSVSVPMCLCFGAHVSACAPACECVCVYVRVDNTYGSLKAPPL